MPLTDMQFVADGDFDDLGNVRVSWPFSRTAAIMTILVAVLGLILITFSSVAAAINARVPARLSANCIASPSEMSTSAMWLASASRTPRQ